MTLSKLAGSIGVALFAARNFDRPLAENDPGT